MIGSQLGDLTIVRLLGAGGMGKVYLAQHTLLDDLQAVKVLDPQFEQNPQVVQRFLNEGRAAVKLRHRNLVAVHHIGRMPDDGPYYMVMEYLDGRTLGRLAASLGAPMNAHLAYKILVQVLNCLQWMHERGAVHRDIKPDNILLVQRFGQAYFPVVLDLGVAQLAEHLVAGPATLAGTLIGTPLYMAPEQLHGDRVSAAADVHAVATIAYELVTGGWFPYQLDHETRAEFMALRETAHYHRQRTTSPVDPRRRAPAVREPLAKVLLAGLAPDPADRPSARDFAWQLADAIASDGHEEDGHTLLKRYASELQTRGEADETLRSSRPELRYELGARIGSGGMAEVYLGKLLGAEGFERPVAIKRVLSGMSDVPAFATMFVAEARLASRLSHPNITTVFDFHRDADGRLCIIMEYVHGRDLAAALDHGPLPPSLIIYIGVEILRGLGHAHGQPDGDARGHGLIHRDMSPHNVLLSYDGSVKITDFGLAKARDVSGNVHSTTIRGKPSYMSPEQCNAEKLDLRSDLFAVGVMLHEMLTHQALFHGTPREVMAQVMMMATPRPSSRRGGVPADLEAVVMRLLAKERGDRYPSAEAVIAELLRCGDAPRDGRGELSRLLSERFLDNAQTRGAMVGSTLRGVGALTPDATASTPPVTTLTGAASQAIPVARSSRRPAVIGGVGFAVLTAAVALVVASRGRSTDAGDPTTMTDQRAAAAADAAPPRVAVVAPPDAAVVAVVADPAPRPDAGVVVAVSDASVPIVRGSGPVVAPDAGTRSPPPDRKPPPVATPKGEGELVITAKPWALIELNGKPVGQTPFRKTLPAGRYRIRLRNDNLDKNETATVTVSPDRPTTIQRTW